MSVWRLHLSNNQRCFTINFISMLLLSSKKRKQVQPWFVSLSVWLFCKVKKDVALFTEAAFNFSSQWPADLPVLPTRWIKFCAGLREAPHIFFFFGTRSDWRKTLNISATSSFIFWKKRSFICFFWRGSCEAELDFQDWFQNHEWWVLDSATYNQRTTATMQQQFPESFSQAWGPKLAWQRILVATTRHLL